jgi:ABC-2 type transport system ATP-binding protein
MIHEPDLLILDEPTIGLDPNQIRAVRDLIRDLGKQHTILLSTHILSEVELTCSRVLVINRGKIEASDTPANLTKLVRGGGSIVLEVRAPSVDVIGKLKQVADVDDVEVVLPAEGEWTQAKIFAKPGVDVREKIYDVVRQNNWPLRELSRVRATLEEAFVELTQD